MTYTLKLLVESIAGALVPLGYPVYASAVQQEVTTPCFFISLMPSTSAGQIDKRYMNDVYFDIVFLQRPDIPNATDDIFTVVDYLNNNLETITYTDGTETGVIHSYDREYHVEDMDLHYHVRFSLRGHIDVSDVKILTLEDLIYEIKGRSSSEQNSDGEASDQ